MAARGVFPVKFNNNYYDLKMFLRDHPGGVNTLEMYKGKSVMQAMKKYGHSNSAYHLMRDFQVKDDELKDVILSDNVSENGRIITSEEASRDEEEIAFLEELESRLDWSKPILRQLDVIAPHYEKWVNSAVYRQCRLFSSPFLESFTYTPWYLVPMFWIPIILYMGWMQYFEHVLCIVTDKCTESRLSTLQYIIHIIQGIGLWTIIEYSMHRWVFHRDPGLSLVMIKIHFLLHGMHHKVPFDKLRQVFPPIPALVLAVILYSAVSPFLNYPRIKLTGALIGYLAYDMVHYYVHHGSPADGSYLYAMKRYHSNHHFVNHDKAYGITTKVWDYIFRTFVKIRKLGISLRW
ncbi:fatty acid 2-hydroxylase [Manduca sexta]|uniref:fatty acid 2-hydroxylase n=1 Tax=Manduca sexta TaxID=7130 RepID=UPI00188F32FD|nr:fatty acid 2-hydroxylase [Manduca sexta]